MSFDLVRTCGVVAVVTFGAIHAHPGTPAPQVAALSVAIPATQALLAPTPEHAPAPATQPTVRIDPRME